MLLWHYEMDWNWKGVFLILFYIHLPSPSPFSMPGRVWEPMIHQVHSAHFRLAGRVIIVVTREQMAKDQLRHVDLPKIWRSASKKPCNTHGKIRIGTTIGRTASKYWSYVLWMTEVVLPFGQGKQAWSTFPIWKNQHIPAPFWIGSALLRCGHQLLHLRSFFCSVSPMGACGNQKRSSSLAQALLWSNRAVKKPGPQVLHRTLVIQAAWQIPTVQPLSVLSSFEALGECSCGQSAQISCWSQPLVIALASCSIQRLSSGSNEFQLPGIFQLHPAISRHFQAIFQAFSRNFPGQIPIFPSSHHRHFVMGGFSGTAQLQRAQFQGPDASSYGNPRGFFRVKKCEKHILNSECGW